MNHGKEHQNKDKIKHIMMGADVETVEERAKNCQRQKFQRVSKYKMQIFFGYKGLTSFKSVA